MRKLKTSGRTIGSDGYVRVYMPDHPRQHGGFVKEHTVIAEKAVGHLLPITVHVHHFDLDEANNANTNLVICQDSAYHMILHARQRIKAQGGNPDTELQCCDCGSIKPDGDFCLHQKALLYRRGRNSRCRMCSSNRATRYREQRREYARKRREHAI